MESSCVRGDPCPDPGPRNRVVQLAAGEFLTAVCLSESVWGKMTHWNDGAGRKGRSEPCTGNPHTCPGCQKKMPKRWKGFLCIMDLLTKKIVFLELTPGSFEMINAQLQPGETLRGLQIQARRGDRGNKTRLQVNVTPFRGDLENLPADHDPATVLKTLWDWGR